MARRSDGLVLRQLRTLFNVGTVRELTDGQLLERFATDRGEAAELAFAVLVERHGPMVMRVCRAVLGDPHDVAGRVPGHVPGPGQAGARALGAGFDRALAAPGRLPDRELCRTAAARHRRLERNAAIAAPRPGTQRDFELERLLHEEIDRLPERYRSPVVLCDLEGRTHEQAARHLGWPVGTVKSRLSRGRERLRPGWSAAASPRRSL